MAQDIDRLPDELQQKTMPGRIWVQAHYKQEGIDDPHVLIDDVLWISVAVFHPDENPAPVGAHLERTIQVKQFEPLDVSVSCQVYARKEEVDPAIEFCLEKVNAHFMPAVRKAHEAMMKIRKGR
jgi:hypothetical protein